MIDTRQSAALFSGVAISMAALGLLAMVGCDSLGEGISNIASSLTPLTPSQAAEYALDQNDADKRREGVTLLVNADFGGEPAYVDMYREYVRFDPDPLVRVAAIAGLARYGEPADAIYIAPHLADKDMQVRWEAAKGLQRLHNDEVVSDLVAVVANEEEDGDVRSAAAIALGQYPQDTVFQVLVAALGARELSVNMAAQHSLNILTGQDFGLDARNWLTWYNQAVRTDTAFAHGLEYFYPTYSRDLSWLEELAFWNKPTFEPPGQPAGLTPKGQRTTYQDEDKQEGPDKGGDETPHEGSSGS